MNKSDFKGVYVFAEQRDGKIQSVALELLGKARVLADKLGEEVVAFYPGYKNTENAKELIAWGADRVIVMDAPELEHYLTEQYSQAMSQAIDKYKPSIVLLGATTIGRDLGPRLASRLATGLTADCTALDISEDRELLMTRPAFGGNLMATIMCTEHRPQMSTVRPGVMQKGTR
ncbi:MAG: electron transfer flavoprotein subunit alpha/FixB family protein, partial [Bacteroidales bacterium]|nr:electron transfer flavoprotein subunit alpha/FixB family protein [Bacteroidales bacterium]